MADLSLCSCLETLKISEDMGDGMSSMSKCLPDLFLHDVATLKSVEFLVVSKRGLHPPTRLYAAFSTILGELCSMGSMADKGEAYIDAVPGVHEAASLAYRYT